MRVLFFRMLQDILNSLIICCHFLCLQELSKILFRFLLLFLLYDNIRVLRYLIQKQVFYYNQNMLYSLLLVLLLWNHRVFLICRQVECFLLDIILLIVELYLIYYVSPLLLVCYNRYQLLYFDYYLLELLLRIYILHFLNILINLLNLLVYMFCFVFL